MPFNGFEDEPDANVIDQYRSHLKEVWTNAHRKWEQYDAYYFRTYSVWEESEAHTRPGWLKPARPTSVVDNAVDHQLASMNWDWIQMSCNAGPKNPREEMTLKKITEPICGYMNTIAARLCPSVLVHLTQRGFYLIRGKSDLELLSVMPADSLRTYMNSRLQGRTGVDLLISGKYEITGPLNLY